MRIATALSAIVMSVAVVGSTVAVALPAQATPSAVRADPCYFVVKAAASASGNPVLPASVRTRIAACADVMAEGFTRAAIRVGKRPSATDRAWQAAIIKEFVSNGCTDITNSDLTPAGCLVFAEKWPYGYAGKIAKPGTVIVVGFEPI